MHFATSFFLLTCNCIQQHIQYMTAFSLTTMTLMLTASVMPNYAGKGVSTLQTQDTSDPRNFSTIRLAPKCHGHLHWYRTVSTSSKYFLLQQAIQKKGLCWHCRQGLRGRQCMSVVSDSNYKQRCGPEVPMPADDLANLPTVCYAEGLWRMCRHGPFTAHCTDSEDFPMMIYIKITDSMGIAAVASWKTFCLQIVQRLASFGRIYLVVKSKKSDEVVGFNCSKMSWSTLY